jgi:dTDP-4-dehydrorhamnose 3,5-epimerase
MPSGRAHGFCTLSDRLEVLYKTSDEYALETDGGIMWNDPALGIAWPVAEAKIMVNARDAA